MFVVGASLSIGGTLKMTEDDIDRVCLAVKRGARMLVGRDHMGRQKIKLIKGPFGLFVERFECTEADVAMITRRLKPAPTARANATHAA
jgi:hypothetical protein